MSERSYEDRLAVRMLDAIDALPVPAGPRALRARRTLARRIDLAPVVVLMLVATLATLVTPAGQSVVAEASRIIQRLIGTSPWIGYYVESPDSGLTWELRFAMGKFPGSPTTAALRSYLPATPASLGGDRWSPDGELFAISEGPRIYVGDRFGRIRKVADAADYRQVIDVAWTGRRALMATARVPAGPQSDGMGPGDIVVTVDVDRATATYRPLPPGIRIDPRPGHVWGTFSPSGRWLIVPDGGSLACRSMRIFDLAADRLIEMADGNARRAIPIGWLRDDRLVWGTCGGPADASGATHVLSVFVGLPGSEGRSVGSVPWSTDASRATSRTHLQTAPIVDIERDRILISSARRDGIDGGSVWALDLDGRVSELARLPRVADLEPDPTYSRIVGLRPTSRDGRLMSIQLTANDPTGGGYGRTGILDLSTGVVTWACTAGTATGSRYSIGPSCNGLQVR